MSRIWGIVIVGLLITGISAGLYLTKNPITFFSQADTSTPSEIKISNISDNSFTVSWITQKPMVGYVNYGEKLLKNNQYDDRDSDGIKSRLTHHVTLKKLKPSTMYYYNIEMAGKIYTNNEIPAVNTAPTTSTPPAVPFPVYGKVIKKNGQNATDVLVYFKTEKGILLSSYVDVHGNWLITLNNARVRDLSTYLNPNNDIPFNIDFQASLEGKNSASGVVKQAQPLTTAKLQ